MAEAKFPHEIDAVFHAFFNMDCLWIGGHDLRNLSCSRHAPNSHHAVHDVALREDPDQFTTTQDRQSADVVFHHKARAFQNRAISFDGIDPAILHKIVDRRRHRRLLWSAPLRHDLQFDHTLYHVRA